MPTYKVWSCFQWECEATSEQDAEEQALQEIEDDPSLLILIAEEVE